MSRVQTTFRFNDKQFSQLNEYAEDLGMTQNAFFIHLLELYRLNVIPGREEAKQDHIRKLQKKIEELG